VPADNAQAASLRLDVIACVLAAADDPPGWTAMFDTVSEPEARRMLREAIETFGGLVLVGDVHAAHGLAPTMRQLLSVARWATMKAAQA
jgi:hypothetical protein